MPLHLLLYEAYCFYYYYYYLSSCYCKTTNGGRTGGRAQGHRKLDAVVERNPKLDRTQGAPAGSRIPGTKRGCKSSLQEVLPCKLRQAVHRLLLTQAEGETHLMDEVSYMWTDNAPMFLTRRSLLRQASHCSDLPWSQTKCLNLLIAASHARGWL